MIWNLFKSISVFYFGWWKYKISRTVRDTFGWLLLLSSWKTRAHGSVKVAAMAISSLAWYSYFLKAGFVVSKWLQTSLHKMLNITDTTLFLSPQNKLKREERKAEQIRQFRSEIVPPRNGTDTKINEHLLRAKPQRCLLLSAPSTTFNLWRFQ